MSVRIDPELLVKAGRKADSTGVTLERFIEGLITSDLNHDYDSVEADIVRVLSNLQRSGKFRNGNEVAVKVVVDALNEAQGVGSRSKSGHSAKSVSKHMDALGLPKVGRHGNLPYRRVDAKWLAHLRESYLTEFEN